MIGAIVTTKMRGNTFFLTPEGMATDIRARAAIFESVKEAGRAAKQANKEEAWKDWRVKWRVQF